MLSDTAQELDFILDGEGAERKAQAAHVTGLEEVSTVRVDLAMLRKSGILIQVSVTGSSLFTRKASYAEFGIADRDERKSRYTPGSRFIFPREIANKWRSVENRLRDALDGFSYDLTGFKPYRWVPWKAIEKWRARFEKLQAEADLIRAEMIENYPVYITRLENEFTGSAVHAWRSVQAQGYDAIIFEGRPYLTEEEFTRAVVEQAMAHVPTVSEVERKLKIDYSAALVYGTADTSADSLRAAQIYEEEELIREQYRARKREANLQAEMLQDQASHQFRMQRDVEDHAHRLRDLAEREAEAKAEAAIRAELERAREEMAQANSYISEIFQGLRDRIAQGAQEMLDSVEKNGFVRGKIAEKGAGLLELYDIMAVHDDQALRNKLHILRDKIGPIGDARVKGQPKRDTQAVAQALQSIIDLADQELEDLTTTSRAEFIEL